jgi:WD40 repeat protein
MRGANVPILECSADMQSNGEEKAPVDREASQGPRKGKALSMFENWSGKTVSFLDRTFGGFSSKQNKDSSAAISSKSLVPQFTQTASVPNNAFVSAATSIVLRPLSDLINIHLSNISSICYDKMSNSLAVCSRDGTAKVYNFYTHSHIICLLDRVKYLNLYT